MSKKKVASWFYRHFRMGLLFAGLFICAGILSGFAAVLGPMPALASGKADTAVTPASIPDLVEKISPTVVNISTARMVKDLLRRDFNQKGLGSGFIISEDGYIFTNNHVVDKADKIEVKLANGKEYDAEIKGRDATTDLALIKITAPAKLPYARLGDSDRSRIGEEVFAIGNPLGLDHTVTAGIISAKGRVIGAGPYDNFIQTDASINPGNSGGPLCNLAGEVVGINTAIVAQAQGIGFAIPINMAKEILEDLKTSGKITRGWLGVTSQDITDDMRQSLKLKDRQGALVGNVFAGDAADKAGIKIGDVILEIAGQNGQRRPGTGADRGETACRQQSGYQGLPGRQGDNPPHRHCGTKRPAGTGLRKRRNRAVRHDGPGDDAGDCQVFRAAGKNRRHHHGRQGGGTGR